MDIFYKILGISPKTRKVAKTIGNETSGISDVSYDSIIREFSKNTIAYRSVQLISNALCNFDIKISGFQLVKAGKFQSITEFLSDIVFSLLITGNCFIRISEKHTMEILFAPQISIAYKDDTIIGYEWKEKSFLSKGEIIHIQLPHAKHEDFGMSPSRVGYGEIKKSNETSLLIYSLVKNGWRSSGIFSYQGNKGNEGIIREEIEELYDRMKRNSAIMVVEGDFKWQALGINPEQMELSKRLQENACSIAQVYGVPPILLGIYPSNQSHNYNEIRNFFILDTVKPLLHLIQDSINNHCSIFLGINNCCSYFLGSAQENSIQG